MPSLAGSLDFVGFFCYSGLADKDDRSMSAFRATIRNELEVQRLYSCVLDPAYYSPDFEIHI
jgi:hypothetical protein